MKLRGLEALAFAFLCGCYSPKVIVQGDTTHGEIFFNYDNDKIWYCCLPINDTHFSIMGKDADKQLAIGEALERLNVLNDFEFLSKYFAKVDEADKIKYVIEDKEYLFLIEQILRASQSTLLP